MLALFLYQTFANILLRKFYKFSLTGMIAFISIAVYTLSSRYIEWMWQDITVHSVFFGGAILCLTFSWLFHTVFCHSESVNKLFSK